MHTVITCNATHSCKHHMAKHHYTQMMSMLLIITLGIYLLKSLESILSCSFIGAWFFTVWRRVSVTSQSSQGLDERKHALKMTYYILFYWNPFLQIPGLPPLFRSGKNYNVAKIAVTKAGLRMLKKKEKENAYRRKWEIVISYFKGLLYIRVHLNYINFL